MVVAPLAVWPGLKEPQLPGLQLQFTPAELFVTVATTVRVVGDCGVLITREVGVGVGVVVSAITGVPEPVGLELLVELPPQANSAAIRTKQTKRRIDLRKFMKTPSSSALDFGPSLLAWNVTALQFVGE